MKLCVAEVSAAVLAPVSPPVYVPYEPPSQRLERAGMSALSDAEVIALVLGGNKALAERLLTTFGSLRALRQATSADLVRYMGIGPARAAALQGALELGSRAIAEHFQAGKQITSPDHVAELLVAQLGHLDHEEFWVVVLNTKNRVLTSYCLYRGTVDSTTIRVSEVFRESIRRNGSALIVGHNHPSSEVIPSPEDVILTSDLIKAAKTLNITLLDHLVVGAGSYYSMRQHGCVAF